MKAKSPNPALARGVRDPRPPTCMHQAGGRLTWVENGQPMFLTDRPRKFPAKIKHRLDWHHHRGRPCVMTDIKWRQSGGLAWWRLPDYPDGDAS